MLRMLKNIFFSLLPCLWLTGCHDECFPKKEPLIGTNIYAEYAKPGSLPPENIRRVFAVGGNRDIPFNGGAGFVLLPVSLNADTTAYLFVQDTRTDTLIIAYQREFFYESARCGFSVRFADSSARVKFTTFRKAEVTLGRCKVGLLPYESNCFNATITR